MALSILVPATLVFAASVGDTIEPLGHLKYAITGEYNRIIDKDLDLIAIILNTGKILESLNREWLRSFALTGHRQDC